MPKTAVGLFGVHHLFSRRIVHDLLASGFHRNDVRILGEPREMAGGGVISIPHTDFEVGLTRDLTTFGSPKQTRKLTSRECGMEESWSSQRVRARRQTRRPRL